MTDFLHLSGWKTLHIHESEHDYHIEAEITTKPPHLCPHCWDFSEFEKFGTRRQIVLDAPVRGKRVGIHFSRQRYRCRKCQEISIHALPDCSDSRRATNRLVRLFTQKSLHETFYKVAREVGVDEKSVRNIFKDWVEDRDKYFKPMTPEILGIDEINIIQPRCVMSNIGQHTIFDLLSKRIKKRSPPAPLLTQGDEPPR